MPERKVFVNSLKLKNLLSFGDKSDDIELGPLNVLIGKNSCGKSNFIEAFSLLKSLPKDLLAPIRRGGGIREWLWKGSDESSVAELNLSLNYPGDPIPLRYRLNFSEVSQRLEIFDEAIESARKTHESEDDVYFYYRYMGGSPVLNVRNPESRAPEQNDGRGGIKRKLHREDLGINQSVLSQRKDPDLYPELTFISNRFSEIRLFRDWNLGRRSPPRLPQSPDLPEDFLLEDMSNLGLVLNNLQHEPAAKRAILENLNYFYDEFDDISTKIHGGTVQIFLHEKKLTQPVPATRLSDGTLRFLCLIVILCHPDPPPLICIEEPELGLHPDILPHVARMLLQASEKTQLIVTTHSDIIVDELTDRPDSVVVCEKHDGLTKTRRLDAESLKGWLKEYSLGELWRSGEIGGNRW
ncbi:SMC domain-containing protein [Candidatus Desulfarcum epimagneticum]|uniref:SMC domain-containing protein n=1 Tax=uncultured Desulfobacteraceae bacterium TaxID=218296 RepID=A0A484HLI9_9BACT|nr:SMC domain-containing protein [uncultured Desulfobacteraceae bacterium]